MTEEFSDPEHIYEQFRDKLISIYDNTLLIDYAPAEVASLLHEIAERESISRHNTVVWAYPKYYEDDSLEGVAQRHIIDNLTSNPTITVVEMAMKMYTQYIESYSERLLKNAKGIYMELINRDDVGAEVTIGELKREATRIAKERAKESEKELFRLYNGLDHIDINTNPTALIMLLPEIEIRTGIF